MSGLEGYAAYCQGAADAPQAIAEVQDQAQVHSQDDLAARLDGLSVSGAPQPPQQDIGGREVKLCNSPEAVVYDGDLDDVVNLILSDLWE